MTPECDLTLVVVWNRPGTPPSYVRPDDGAYASAPCGCTRTDGRERDVVLINRKGGRVSVGPLVLCGRGSWCWPAEPVGRTERLPIRTYTTADGLAHHIVNRIVKDSRGFLWFCTADGLSRFDGYAFANFGTDQGLPHAHVNDLLETRGGEYWVATDGGLVYFDPRGRPASRVISESEATTSGPMFAVVVPGTEDLRATAVTVLLEGRDGTIWAGTNNGLYRLEGAKGHRSLQRVEIGIPRENAEQGVIQDLLEDARGSLWIAAPSGLYRRWSDGSAARYTIRDGLPARLGAGPARRSRRPSVGGHAHERLLPLQR